MSRSDYNGDGMDYRSLILWRGAVASAIRGKRGQALLQEMLTALDAMPEKRLISSELQNENGEHCALGVVAQCRSLDVSGIDPEDYEQVAKAFRVAPALIREITFENDEAYPYDESPESRWTHVRQWVKENIKK
ncbi:MAG: hypothetical protein KGL39_42035 [Patescibacteria group bacterium]|nr:hypothetical protein [Patescibacteria group bacterium]